MTQLREGSVAQLAAFLEAIRLRRDGARARRLREELEKDPWAWDAHAAAAGPGR